MATQRTITVTLTEGQFNALSGAVARGQYEVKCEMEDDVRAHCRDHATAERAWDKLADAWQAKGRKP